MWRAAGLISALTMVSRVLGLVREQVFVRLLGTGLYAEAFVVAFRIPNLLRDLFAEGALSAAFMPTYARALREGGSEAAHRLASRVFSVLAVVLAGLVLLGALAAPLLVRAMAGGFDAQQVAFTALLTRIMLPFLPLVSFAAVAMGMLNAEGRFGMPALAPAIFNVAAIVTAAVLWALGLGPYWVAVGWSVGTLLGGLGQFVVQLPSLWRAGWRYRFDWAPGDPALRQIAALMAPATMGMAAVQINLFFSTWFLSYEKGALVWLQCAFRLLYLPIGLFGVAVGTIAASGLAKQAAAGETAGLTDTLRRSLRSLAFLTVPSTVGLVVLAEPIVRLIFEHGRFLPSDTTHTANALAIYAVGLVAYASLKVLAPAFYALGNSRVPLLASGCAVASNIATMFLLHPYFGYRGVATGLVVSTFVNVLVLIVALRRTVGPFGGPGLGRFVAHVFGAAAAMGLVAMASARALEMRLGTHGLLAQGVVALVPIGLGAAVYFGLTALLRVPEAHGLRDALRRRRG